MKEEGIVPNSFSEASTTLTQTRQSHYKKKLHAEILGEHRYKNPLTEISNALKELKQQPYRLLGGGEKNHTP